MVLFGTKNEGDDEKPCKHEWIEDSTGGDIEDAGEYYATYINVYYCSKCGAEMTNKVRGLI